MSDMQSRSSRGSPTHSITRATISRPLPNNIRPEDSASSIGTSPSLRSRHQDQESPLLSELGISPSSIYSRDRRDTYATKVAGNPFISPHETGGLIGSNRPWVEDLRYEEPRRPPPVPSTICPLVPSSRSTTSGRTLAPSSSRQPQQIPGQRFDPLPRGFSVNTVQTTFRHEMYRLRQQNLPVPEHVERGAQIEADMERHVQRLDQLEEQQRKEQLGYRGRAKEWMKKKRC